MSKHTTRPRSEATSPARIAGYLLVPVVVVLTIAVAPRLYNHWFLPNDTWRSYPAQVIGTRIVRVGPSDSPWGYSILYRAEIDAAWSKDGLHREAWVPTTKLSRDQAWLALWIAQQGKRCIVRESPSNPSARLAYFDN